MDVRTLITADALMIAALLSWGQLWVLAYQRYQADGHRVWHPNLFLAAIFTAVLASLLSIALAAWSSRAGAKKAPSGRAIGLAGFSIIIIAPVVALSAIKAFIDAWRGVTDLRPWVLPGSAWWWTLGALVAGLLTLAACWFWLGPRLSERWSKESQGEDN